MRFHSGSTWLAVTLLILAALPRIHADDPTDEFAKHVVRAVRLIHQHHFAADSKPDMIRWAVVGLYAAVKEPVPAAIDRRLAALKNDNEKDWTELLREVHASVGQRKELAKSRALEVSLAAIFAQLEPGVRPGEQLGSVYVPDVVSECDGASFNHFLGIGIELEVDRPTGFLRVQTPLSKGPAHMGGVRGGDLITEITVDTNANGSKLAEPSVISTRGLSVAEAMRLFLGTEGTGVRLTVIRDNMVPADPLPYALAEKFATHVISGIRLVATSHVAVASQKELASWAVVGLYRAVHKPIPERIAARLETLEDAKRAKELLIEVRSSLGKRKDLADDRDLIICLDAMFGQLEAGVPADRRSSYITPDKVEPISSGEGTPNAGIGVQLEVDRSTGFLRVRTPFSKGPAHKAGIRGGDLITEITVDTDKDGGKLAEPRVVSTEGLSVDAAMGLFYGRYGTSVRLKILRGRATIQK